MRLAFFQFFFKEFALKKGFGGSMRLKTPICK
jgi:hypothetical protein